jgi:rod shape-determining protein MreC
MLEFLRRNRVLLASGCFLLVAAALLLRTGAGRLQTDRLGRLLLDGVSPLQRITATAARAVTGVWREAVDLMQARDEVVALRSEVERLAQEETRTAELEGENARLRQLLDFRERLAGDLIAAHVVGRDATGLARTIVIDRGERDGVFKGTAVVVPAGVVGHVFVTSRHAARVLLVNDHNSGVDGMVQRTRASGIVEGTPDGGCGLKFVKRTEDVQTGDEVVTSGLDGIFPKGLPIGRVVAVDKRGQGLFQYAEIAPAVEFDRLEEVLVTRGAVELREPETLPEG